MESKLPAINIEGTDFLFDIEDLVLIEKNNPGNYIPFSYMRDYGTHYSFTYSALSKNYHFVKTEETFFETNDDNKISDHPIQVEIPRIGVLDPEGMSRKYGCSLEDIALKSDFEIMVDQKVFHDRMSGMPVIIEFPGRRFEVDVSKNLLRPEDGIGENIYLGEFEYDYYLEGEEVYHLYYDIKKGTVVNPIHDGSWDETEDRVIIEIPQLSELDPIGTNIAFGWSPTDGLLYEDLKMNHQVNIVPWSDFGHDQSIEESLKLLPEIDAWLPKNADKLEVQPTEPPLDVNQSSIESTENKQILMERELPIINIEGTEFIVDVNRFELREKNNAENKLSIFDMEDLEEGKGYTFEYSPLDKRFPTLFTSGNSVMITIPEMVKIDPEGMSAKYGVALDLFGTKNDFDLIVDQNAFQKRMNGRLPTIAIEGHTFFVDLHTNKLRPEDDFLSNGIVFSDIEKYYDYDERTYTIPYNPKTHEFQEPDYPNIKEFPKDLIAVKFPSERLMDRIGWNKKYKLPIRNGLTRDGLKLHFAAKNIPWEKTFLLDFIKKNLKTNQIQNKGKGRKL